MSLERSVQSTKISQANNVVASGVLQRKCACGQHMPGGGECAGCKKKKLNQPLQSKLRIGEPKDKYEQEADRVADQVMRMPVSHNRNKQGYFHAPPIIQTRVSNSQNGATEVPAIVHDVLRSSGQPLDQATRDFMEPRFGQDLSSVRVHTGTKASESARGINALAYTVGRDIVFGAGQYFPRTSSGQHLLAHELTHTVQQNRNLLSPMLQRTCGAAAIGSVSGCIGSGGQDIFDVGMNSNDIYLFEKNCDEFRTGEDIRLETFAATISPEATIEVHGFASEEGDATFNENLSCARANVAARIISSATSAAIVVFKHGATPGLREDRRSVVITVFEPEPEPEPELPVSPTPTYVACHDGSTVYVNKNGRSNHCSIALGSAGNATPNGEYCIREQGAAQLGRSLRHPLRDHSDWFLLEPQFSTTRFRMHLHPGSVTAGCVTVTDDDCFARIAGILNSPGRISRDGYDGYPPGNSEGVTNPRSSKTCVGLLTVRNGGSCSFMSGTTPP